MPLDTKPNTGDSMQLRLMLSAISIGRTLQLNCVCSDRPGGRGKSAFAISLYRSIFEK